MIPAPRPGLRALGRPQVREVGPARGAEPARDLRAAAPSPPLRFGGRFAAFSRGVKGSRAVGRFPPAEGGTFPPQDAPTRPLTGSAAVWSPAPGAQAAGPAQPRRPWVSAARRLRPPRPGNPGDGMRGWGGSGPAGATGLEGRSFRDNRPLFHSCAPLTHAVPGPHKCAEFGNWLFFFFFFKFSL